MTPAPVRTINALRRGGDGLDWLDEAIADYVRIVGDPNYPCNFATSSLAQETSAYLALAASPDRIEALAGALNAVALDTVREVQSLVVFLEAEAPQPLERTFADTWATIRELHGIDAAPWPAETPADPDDLAWEFCFAGVSWFVLTCSSGYVRRRSRNLGAAHILIFQPSWIFAGLKSSSAAGQHAKRVIRERLVAYDGAADPHLGPLEVAARPKWHHYVLPDIGDRPLASICPFRIGVRP